MDADGFIATQESNFTRAHEFSFDVILSTASSTVGLDLGPYLLTLKVHGKFIHQCQSTRRRRLADQTAKPFGERVLDLKKSSRNSERGPRYVELGRRKGHQS